MLCPRCRGEEFVTNSWEVIYQRQYLSEGEYIDANNCEAELHGIDPDANTVCQKCQWEGLIENCNITRQEAFELITPFNALLRQEQQELLTKLHDNIQDLERTEQELELITQLMALRNIATLKAT